MPRELAPAAAAAETVEQRSPESMPPEGGNAPVGSSSPVGWWAAEVEKRLGELFAPLRGDSWKPGQRWAPILASFQLLAGAALSLGALTLFLMLVWDRYRHGRR